MPCVPTYSSIFFVIVILPLSLYLFPAAAGRLCEVLPPAQARWSSSSCLRALVWKENNHLVVVASACSAAKHNLSELQQEQYLEMEREWEGEGWTGELWFVFLHCSAWWRPLGRHTETKLSQHHCFYQQGVMTLSPFLCGPLLTFVSLANLACPDIPFMSFCVSLWFPLLKLVFNIINGSHRG